MRTAVNHLHCLFFQASNRMTEQQCTLRRLATHGAVRGCLCKSQVVYPYHRPVDRGSWGVQGATRMEVRGVGLSLRSVLAPVNDRVNLRTHPACNLRKTGEYLSLKLQP
jgi:hypothetical protein